MRQLARERLAMGVHIPSYHELTSGKGGDAEGEHERCEDGRAGAELSEARYVLKVGGEEPLREGAVTRQEEEESVECACAEQHDFRPCATHVHMQPTHRPSVCTEQQWMQWICSVWQNTWPAVCAPWEQRGWRARDAPLTAS
jgi:hypothetical protein